MGQLYNLQGDLYLVRGRNQVLALASTLEALAQSTAQLGAMHWLAYFLSTRSRASKPPFLVLQLDAPVDFEHLHPRNIRAAALFFEYSIAGLHSGVFSSDDAVGYRTVIAPAARRESFACQAALALLQGGHAHIVLTNADSIPGNESAPLIAGNILAGRRHRIVPRMLPLSPSYDETLARLGQKTRFNLRYYRRRLSTRMQLQFIPDASTRITAEELQSLNRASLNPVSSAHELQLRWNSSTTLSGGFVVGLRSSTGDWLSLIGGWRQQTTTVLHWQLNVAGYEKDSIGTVMRSFFLEHEIARGAHELLIYGGTPHSIAHSFTQDTIADLLLSRRSLRARIYRGLATRLNRYIGATRSNHLIRTLAEVKLQPGADPSYPAPAALHDSTAKTTSHYSIPA